MSYPIIESSSEKMDKVIEHLHAELNQIRTGMANAKMLDRVEVEYYGSTRLPVFPCRKAERSSSSRMILLP